MVCRLIGLLLSCLALCTCGSVDDKRTPVIVFHAGSLSLPLMELEAAFEAEYPDYDIQREAAGSRACARKISDLHRECDVFLSADDEVITSMLMPDHASWSFPFATNEICLVYREGNGLRGGQKTLEWMDVLAQKKLRVGRSDPDSDPCGYRTIQALKLADLENGTKLSNDIVEESERNVRPKSADLIAMLETGALDAAFMYRSVADQHGLDYIEFPDEINLGNRDMADRYSKIRVEVSGATPDDSIELVAVPIVYGLTIPTNATQEKGAQQFILFLISSQGTAIFEKHHQPVLRERSPRDYGTIPDSLQPYVQE
jgi:molybdate/tungstate transport system substrate-binding protein